MTQGKIGWRAYVNPFTPEDPGTPNTIDQDSTNFIIAAGISDSVQISAIETLVSDLKSYGLWTKMKAIYPFVGGSAASHKWNLKDPRNLDAAYRLVFNGGWVHSSNGAKPNGTNGYANTFLIPNINLTLNDVHLSYYSKTNILTTQQDMGAGDNRNSFPSLVLEVYRDFSSTQKGIFWSYNGGYGTDSSYGNSTNINSLGFYIGSRLTSNSSKFYKNSNVIGSNNNTSLGMQPLYSLWIGGQNYMNTLYAPSSRESGFTSIGDGLTDTEAANFYIAVQKFQTTLGRHVGTPYVSDPDAIAFLNAAGITDGTQAAAINTLVIRMKADGVWTKMKAIYPFVGGSATSHKWNLKDPRDLDAAYRLVFNGGGTHNSTGYVPNLNSYADTKLNPSTVLNIDSIHFSYYSRTNLMVNNYDMGVTISSVPVLSLTAALRWGDGVTYYSMGFNPTEVNKIQTSTDKNFIFNKITTSASLFENTTKTTTSVTNRSGLPNGNFFIAARNLDGTAQQSPQRNCAFSSIGDGLTDTEVTAFYNAVQAFQTTLGRQVNVPLVSDTDAQAFLNAANITSFQQASAVNKLVVDLKAAGVWTKMKAIYPFVGGSAASHKWNLKDPRDLDAAFRLVFNGGWTHTGTGAQPNGITGYADTKWTQSINGTINNQSLSVYNRTNNTYNGVDMGARVGLQSDLSLAAYGGSPIVGRINTYANSAQISGTITGFWQITRVNTLSQTLYLNNQSSTSTITTSTDIVNLPIYIGAMNVPWLNNAPTYAGYFSNREQAFASIGDGLSDAEAAAFYTAVQTYQTSLGRAVNTPVYNNGLVLNLDAGNANSYPGTGTTWFDLAAGNNGTLTNGPTYDTANGGSIVFDGVNDYVGLGNTPIFGTSSFTIDMWIYLPISDYNYRAILSKRSNSNYTGFAVYRPPYSNSVAIQLASNSSGPYFTTSIPSTANNWNHISIVVDRTLKTVVLYSNGIKNTTTLDITNLGDMTNNGVNLNLGLEAGITNWNNKISTTKIYSRALSETEVLNNFNSTRGRFGL